jgi:hypothetical protein
MSGGIASATRVEAILAREFWLVRSELYGYSKRYFFSCLDHSIDRRI